MPTKLQMQICKDGIHVLKQGAHLKDLTTVYIHVNAIEGSHEEAPTPKESVMFTRHKDIPPEITLIDPSQPITRQRVFGFDVPSTTTTQQALAKDPRWGWMAQEIRTGDTTIKITRQDNNFHNDQREIAIKIHGKPRSSKCTHDVDLTLSQLYSPSNYTYTVQEPVCRKQIDGARASCDINILRKTRQN